VNEPGKTGKSERPDLLPAPAPLLV